MASTVITGRRAGAFRRSDGNIIYALFEETYEKNCYPHTPHWGCIVFGDAKAVTKNLFLRASSVEGGMLQKRSGAFLPENYLKAWLKELDAPFLLPDFDLTLKIKGWSGTVTSESPQKDNVLQVLSQMGHSIIAEALRSGGSYEINLYHDTDVFMALYGTVMAPWRAFAHHQLDTRSAWQDLRFSLPVGSAMIQPDPVVYRIGGNDYLIERPDGTLVPGDWAYRLIGNYIIAMWENPTDFVTRIRKFRQTVETAPILLPASLKVVVDTTVVLESKYEQESVQKVREKFPTRPTDTGFEVDVESVDQLYSLFQIPMASCHWERIHPEPALKAA